jgi:type II secretory pathway component PulK
MGEAGRRPAGRGQEGVVLLVVLFFALLLTGGVATFLRRTTVDSMIARNREQAAQADALARGGVRLAEALLLEDRLREQQGQPPLDTHLDPWAQVRDQPIPSEVGTLTLRIEDTGARFNLNALFEVEGTGGFRAREESEELLVRMLEKVIEELPLAPAERSLYEPRELAQNLIDWVDADSERRSGGPEDDYYQQQDPPYAAYNRPLFSVDELRLVEGFDAHLVAGLAPYVSVYPFAPGGCGTAQRGCGVNLNTAPPHVLALLYFNDGVEQRLADEELIRSILRRREEGVVLCPEGQSDPGCEPMNTVVTNANTIFPPPSFSSEIFVVTAQARVGDVRREVEAVVDRSDPAALRLLSWRER